MNRRDFLKFLLGSAAATYVDYEKLLWVPGEKVIFLPNQPFISESQIVAQELARIAPKLATLFERDATFYTALENWHIPIISSREMRIPLIIQPGGVKDEDPS